MLSEVSVALADMDCCVVPPLGVANGLPHEAVEPLVVKYFPALPVWFGRLLAATKAVVAILVLLSPVVGVGAVGVPVKAGLFSGATPAGRSAKTKPRQVGDVALPEAGPAKTALAFWLA